MEHASHQGDIRKVLRDGQAGRNRSRESSMAL
jgi:hypothetical protein